MRLAPHFAFFRQLFRPITEPADSADVKSLIALSYGARHETQMLFEANKLRKDRLVEPHYDLSVHVNDRHAELT